MWTLFPCTIVDMRGEEEGERLRESAMRGVSREQDKVEAEGENRCP